ncbi:MAG: universal stress protein, partial [Gemmatimonadetes bacterium]|nr:universal stress protein [Gemmatimonadota bacterium]NIR77147.1 universal stress protein [Gemmatimonadota bacterium]NIT85662.1 universal stress protein [Gemmatimonadota bacterium]NIU29494.1 universal stress protein [Gemmatimonadota bacterium]NIU34548.1 universal stress protein [Gemmatimonadota bacterium]
STVEAIVEENRQEAERQLTALKHQVESPEVRVRTIVSVAPNAARAIEEIAARERTSLVVCAAHGRSAHAAWTYGTVSGSLLSHGDTPILVFQDFPDRDDGDAPFRGSSVRASRPRATWSA